MQALSATFVGLIALGILDGLYHFKVTLPRQWRQEAMARMLETACTAVWAVSPMVAAANGYKVSTEESWVLGIRYLVVRFFGNGPEIIYHFYARWSAKGTEIVIDHSPAGTEVPKFLTTVSQHMAGQWNQAA